MIKFDSVVKRYPDGTTAVDGLDLVAPSGQITVLVGPSGCGKTTSLRMVNRMVEPSSGTVWLDDRDTASVPAAELRRGIGYVIQQAGLFPHRTIVDNIATVPLLLGWDKRKARQRSLELMERVGLPPELAGRYPAQLSGGQQQRVGVARADQVDGRALQRDPDRGPARHRRGQLLRVEADDPVPERDVRVGRLLGLQPDQVLDHLQRRAVDPVEEELPAQQGTVQGTVRDHDPTLGTEVAGS